MIPFLGVTPGVILLKGLAQIVCQRVREANSTLSEFLEPI